MIGKIPKYIKTKWSIQATCLVAQVVGIPLSEIDNLAQFANQPEPDKRRAPNSSNKHAKTLRYILESISVAENSDGIRKIHEKNGYYHMEFRYIFRENGNSLTYLSGLRGDKYWTSTVRTLFECIYTGLAILEARSFYNVLDAYKYRKTINDIEMIGIELIKNIK